MDYVNFKTRHGIVAICKPQIEKILALKQSDSGTTIVFEEDDIHVLHELHEVQRMLYGDDREEVKLEAGIFTFRVNYRGSWKVFSAKSARVVGSMVLNGINVPTLVDDFSLANGISLCFQRILFSSAEPAIVSVQFVDSEGDECDLNLTYVHDMIDGIASDLWKERVWSQMIGGQCSQEMKDWIMAVVGDAFLAGKRTPERPQVHQEIQQIGHGDHLPRGME